jgi:AbrB family looped-hinge helix DNA binding protein
MLKNILSESLFLRLYFYLITELFMIMGERVKVGLRGQVVIPKRLRKKLNIENGIILEIEETAEGLILKPYNPVAELKGEGKGVFGEPVKYQKKLRDEWERQK